MARKVTSRVDLDHALKATKATAAKALSAAQAIASAEKNSEESAAARRAAYAEHAPTVAAWCTGGRGRAATVAVGIAGVPSRKADRSDEQEAVFLAAQQTVSRWTRAGLLMASHPSADAEVRETMIRLGNVLTVEECKALAVSPAWTPKAGQSAKQVRAILEPGKPAGSGKRGGSGKPAGSGKPGKPASTPAPTATNNDDGATIAAALAKLAARVRETGATDPNHDAIMKAMKAYADAHNAAVKKNAA